MSVNLWSVLYGIEMFVPLMLEQGDECHIVNTASPAGLKPGGGLYGLTKHAVVSLTETLYKELQDTNIGVSVFCPAPVRTRILESNPRRGDWDAGDFMRQILATGMDPDEAADYVFKGIAEKQLYITTRESDRVLTNSRSGVL